MAQEERGPMMVVILKMMVGIMQIGNKGKYPLSPFTDEDDFTHATQDEDHGSRRAGPGIKATRKPYRGQ